MNRASVHIGSTLVLGLGKTGLAVARFLASRLGREVDSVCVYGGLAVEASPKTRELEELGCEIVLGSEDVRGSYDLGIASPGIPESSSFYQVGKAACAQYISEPELAWRISPERWIAITGTNGKTTTTSLACELLHAGGLKAAAVGNIGALALEEAAARTEGEWLVCELSSYQLNGATLLHPHIAALGNIAPDHLSWHGGYERYIAAKERIFANLKPDDLAVVGVDDEPCRAIAARLHSRGLRVCEVSVEAAPSSPDAAWLAKGELYLRHGGVQEHILAANELQIPGIHNVQNALIASVIALETGVSLADIRQGLKSFVSLEHRIELVAEHAGVRFINDSKATNVDAATRALKAYPTQGCVVLLGGRDKGTPLDDFARIVAKHARVAVCFGEAKERFLQALCSVQEQPGAAGLELVEAEHLADAFGWAAKMAKPGEVVLLSPACSSFDEFSNYEERGKAFKAMVREYLREKDQPSSPTRNRED